MDKIRILFLGTGAFACQILKILLSDHKTTIVQVITTQTKPNKLLKHFDLMYVDFYLKTFHPEIKVVFDNKLKNDLNNYQKLDFDLVLVCDFNHKLDESWLNNFTCLNIHPSLLPRWRGQSPIENALFFNDRKTGLTIYQMNEEIDAGPILIQWECAIEQNDTYFSLCTKFWNLFKTNYADFHSKLNQLKQNNQQLFTPQITANSTKCTKIAWRSFNSETLISDFKRYWRIFYGRQKIVFQTSDIEFMIYECKFVNDPELLLITTQEIFYYINPHLFLKLKNGYIELLTLQLPNRNLQSQLSFVNGNLKLHPNWFYRKKTS